MKNRRILMSLFALLLSGVVFSAPRTSTLTFDTHPGSTPVDGEYYEGVSFSFDVNDTPSVDARFSAYGPGQITYVQDPSLEGSSSGVLTLEFKKPTTIVEFGLALSTLGNLENAAKVELYRPGAGRLNRVLNLNTSSNPSFTEGKFKYRGPAVKTVKISFNRRGRRFALDNLVYNPHPNP